MFNKMLEHSKARGDFGMTPTPSKDSMLREQGI